MATPAESPVAETPNEARAAKMAGELLANASLEVALREAGKLPEAAPLLPSGTCVYVPSLPARPRGGRPHEARRSTAQEACLQA